MLAIDTGWPPPVLLVTVIMPKGMRWPCSLSTASTRARSMLPLKGYSSAGCRPSAMTRSTASTPMNSRLPRVVSKWQLFGTRSPALQVAPNSTFSAARPWCVGTKYCMPVMF